MSRPYLNPGPRFLRWVAGLLMLFILMSLVGIQWEGIGDDDDSSIDVDDSAEGSSE